MTAATTATAISTRPGPTLEELVDRLIDAVFGLDPTVPARSSPARAIHEARRLSREGELDQALAVFAELDLTGATDGETRWAQAEFLDLARRRFGGEDAWLYRAGSGRAAPVSRHGAGVLTPLDEGTLEVRAVLGMRWRPGKRVSRRSLRGLRPLTGRRAS
jgi:hypothetical protein